MAQLLQDVRAAMPAGAVAAGGPPAPIPGPAHPATHEGEEFARQVPAHGSAAGTNGTGVLDNAPGLFAAAPAQLYQELGLRLQALHDNPATGGTYSFATVQAVPPPGIAGGELLATFQEWGLQFFQKLETQLYNVICNSDPQAPTAADHATFENMVNAALHTAGIALAGLLVAELGIAASIAAVLAALVVKLVFNAGFQVSCAAWQHNVPGTVGAAPAAAGV